MCGLIDIINRRNPLCISVWCKVFGDQSVIIQCVLVYTIRKFVGTRSAHMSTREHMLYSMECMEHTFFNWCEGILVSLKDQMNKRKQGQLKQFGYGVVVVSFILQRVSHMRPKVAVSS